MNNEKNRVLVVANVLESGAMNKYPVDSIGDLISDEDEVEFVNEINQLYERLHFSVSFLIRQFHWCIHQWFK